MQLKTTVEHRIIEFLVRWSKQWIKAHPDERNFLNVNCRRDPKKRFDDCFKGKLGEFAFSDMISKQFGVDIAINFSINSRSHKSDSGRDVVSINGKAARLKCEIKAIPFFSNWLLVEKPKFDKYNQDIFILIKVGELIPFEKEFLPITCQFIGFAFRRDLFDRNLSPWFCFHRNDRLYSKQYIDFCYNSARKRFGRIVDRKMFFLNEGGVRKRIKRDIFCGPRLVCECNLGLREDFLRKNIKGLIHAMNLDNAPYLLPNLQKRVYEKKDRSN